MNEESKKYELTYEEIRRAEAMCEAMDKCPTKEKLLELGAIEVYNTLERNSGEKNPLFLVFLNEDKIVKKVYIKSGARQGRYYPSNSERHVGVQARIDKMFAKESPFRICINGNYEVFFRGRSEKDFDDEARVAAYLECMRATGISQDSYILIMPLKGQMDKGKSLVKLLGEKKWPRVHLEPVLS